MGKTPKPTQLLISPQLWDWPEFVTLRQQGHVIEVEARLDAFDLVLGPKCWNMSTELQRYLLSHSLPAARVFAALRKAQSEPSPS